MAPKIRIPVRERINHKKIDRLALECGWLLYDVVKASKHAPREKIWTLNDGKTVIHWIEDHAIDVCYVLVDCSKSEEVFNIIREKIPHYDIHSLRDMVSKKKDRKEH